MSFLQDPATALIVVDIQNDFLPGGALPVPQGDEVIAPINRLIENAFTVVLTADWHPSRHKSFAINHPGKKLRQAGFVARALRGGNRGCRFCRGACDVLRRPDPSQRDMRRT